MLFISRHSEPIISGVVTRFKVMPSEISSTDVITVDLRMTNVTSNRVKFRYSGCIQNHIDLFSSHGKLVVWKQGAPLLECPYIEVTIEPRATVERTARFKFGDHYSVPPAEYEMRFKYDLRLIKPDSLQKQWVPWTNTQFKLIIKK